MARVEKIQTLKVDSHTNKNRKALKIYKEIKK